VHPIRPLVWACARHDARESSTCPSQPRTQPNSGAALKHVSSFTWIARDASPIRPNPEPSPPPKTSYKLTAPMRRLERPWREWIWAVGDDFAEHIRLRQACLSNENTRRKVLATDGAPETLEAARELAELLVSHLVERFPEHFCLNADATELFVRPTKETYLLEDWLSSKPMDLISCICVEDMVLLKPVSDAVQKELEEREQTVLDRQYDVALSCVCFSFGNLHARLSLPLVTLHENVPGFAQDLRKVTDKIFAKMTPDRGYTRHNWEMRTNGEMLHPSIDLGDAVKGQLDVQRFRSMSPEQALESLWFRSEYQSVRRLPRSGFVLFAVRSQTDPLVRLKEHPTVARELLHRMDNMSPAFLEYKGIPQTEKEQIRRYILGMAEGPVDTDRAR